MVVMSFSRYDIWPHLYSYFLKPPLGGSNTATESVQTLNADPTPPACM